MKDLSVMNMFQSEAYLSKPVHNLTFRKVSALLGNNQTGKVTAISKVHHNAQMTLFGFVYLSEGYDVRVVENFKNLGFF